ncbi:MAG: PilT/PilU family type 4a pilus ATPase [Gammaproteobacteria bacterium]|nr:PilT/PilU family type 4a pilus ATPase [Gammaproteobacteria bacterium]
MDITPYLKLLRDKEGSDLFFSVGAPVKIKIEGLVNSVGKTVLTGELTKAAAFAIMSSAQIERFEHTLESDFAISLDDKSARYRVNVFRQRGEVGMVLRRIPSNIPTIEELNLPDILKSLVMHKRGLILMVGATGSGKSTTLAAMVNERNQKMSGHILTIEDPIEFSHPNLKSIVNQREIGVDTLSYRAALRSSLREAPDVILIGEIRDRETMEAALELCNTGHLCLSTLHANNANQALERVINLFPQDLHKQLFLDLSLNIRSIISQRLVQGLDGFRVAAIEILINTPHLADLILKGQIGAVKEAMEQSGAKGMQTFDMALFNLYKEERIDLEEALNNADSRTNLEARINFG